MWLTLFWMIVVVSIFAAFAAEFYALLGWLMELPGIRLFLPLLLASFIVITYEHAILQVLLWFGALLYWLVLQLGVFYSKTSYSFMTVKIFVLMLLPAGPLGLSFYLKTPRNRHFWSIFTVVIWVIGVFLMGVLSHLEG
jgi:hypothetical protein